MTSMMGGMFLLWLLLSVLEIGLVIYAIVDLARKPMDPAMKIVWLLVILVFPILGSIAWLIFNRTPAATA